ncbi:hypothetical protein [Burkholderia sp. Bp9015]|uniref:hypothetical protein n=1 Tax=Burkholderia sp. Bp9015 TaxID=2184563 RepID=UPI000F59ACD7|nr:hypothetical protein [Burkholderia sp. Bp9015]RQR65236.1 hypothetical protein DIE12_31900 [Burkholderia sp. Bp9015]
MIRRPTARQCWYAAFGLFLLEAIGLLTIAPAWKAGTMEGEINVLAFFVAGIGIAFLLLARTRPGSTLGTQGLRYLFALMGGSAANVLLTWATWACGFAVSNGTIKRGIMGENYWLGPTMLAYATIVWLAYRAGLRRESAVDGGSTNHK